MMTDNPNDAETPDEIPGKKVPVIGISYWSLIAEAALIVPMLFPLGIVLAFLGPGIRRLGLFLVSLWAILIFPVAGVAFHFDRKYVRAVSDWDPSVNYYWMAVPVPGMAVTAYYIYQRHERVGEP